MAKYIIRLDDACPTMNHVNWDRIERLLDKYNVKPIVGIIPNNKSEEFVWEEDKKFWEKARRWQEKSWTIAQHGFEHVYFYHVPVRGYYQLSHSTNTEFAGISLNEQIRMLQKGNLIMKEHDIYPICFFAPAHTYDINTVEALKKIEGIKFISDGYALRIFKKNDMNFLPSICDGPFKMPFGLYTYVFHPSVMKEKDFKRIEKFLETSFKNIISVESISWEKVKKQGILGKCTEYGVFFVRSVRKKIRKNNIMEKKK